MPRGGKRNGKAGAAYSNRTDLNGSPQAIKAAPGQAYGVAQQQREAQSVIPVAGTPMTPAPGAAAAGGSPAAAAPPSGPMPGEVASLLAPTSRPGEPVTAGLPIGAGAGPEALNGAMDSNGIVIQLQAIYSRYPTEQIRQLLELAQEEGL